MEYFFAGLWDGLRLFPHSSKTNKHKTKDWLGMQINLQFYFPSELQELILGYLPDVICLNCKAWYPKILQNCLSCLQNKRKVKYITNSGFEKSRETNYDFEFNDRDDQYIWNYVKPIITDAHTSSSIGWFDSKKGRHQLTFSVQKKRRRSPRFPQNALHAADWWTMRYYPLFFEYSGIKLN